MDDYGLELSGLDPDSIAELRRLRRQQTMADELAKRGMTPLQGQMVGNVYVRPSVFQGLAGLANSWAAKGEQDRIDEGYKSLSEKRKAVEAAQLENYRKGTIGSPEIPIPEDGIGPGRPAMPATPEQRRAAITEAITMGNPRLAKMATLDMQQDWRKEDKAAAAQQRMAELAMRMEDARLSREERLAAQKELVKMQIEGRRDIATLAAGLRPEPAPITLTDAAGNVKLVDRKGNLVKDLGAAGKPSGEFVKSANAKKKLSGELDTAISELEKATADGGLIDKSTGSGAGALVDAAAGFVGKATPGSIAVGQMKPIFDLALKMVPRFEGPQSDKDTASYKEAAGELANPAVPNERKKAAGKEILRLMKARKGQFTSKDIEGTEADIPTSGASNVRSEADKILGL